MLTLLFLLISVHALVDYTFQTEWMAVNKNRHAGGAPSGYNARLHGPLQVVWPYVLSAHALQHGLGVFLVTRNVWLGLAEAAAHWLIDFGKCERMYGIHADQFLHVLCKVIWLLILLGGGTP